MMWSAQNKRKLTGYKMKDNSSERSRSHRVVGGGEDFFPEWQIDFFGRPTFTTAPLSFIKRGAQTAHLVLLGQFELAITEMPNRSLSWRFILFHIWRNPLKDNCPKKDQIVCFKNGQGPEKRCKVSKINTAHEIQPPSLYLDFYENHCQLFVVCRLTWLCMRNLVSKSSDQHKK